MTDITSALRELGNAVFPATPDLSRAVRSRLEASPSRTRRWLVPAVVTAVVLLALSLVPQSRQAIASFFGIGAVRISEFNASELPTVALVDNPPGRLGTLVEAREVVDFDIRAPRIEGLNHPEIYINHGVSGGMVTLIYRSNGKAWLALSQLIGAPDRDNVVKQIDEVTAVPTRVGNADAFWIAGPHVVLVFDPLAARPLEPLLAGNTLVWQEGEVTYRLEGGFTLDQAKAVAESLEPLSRGR
jgi:hypothetical protein